MKTFKKICRKDQYTLKGWLYKLLKAKYKEVVNEDGFLYAKGDGRSPILLTAHMDTVHKETCKDIKVTKVKEGTKIWSPQGIGGDDRCGIWMIWMVLCRTKYRPSILFCEDEEIGGIGSGKFVKTDYIDDLTELKYLVELDRAHDKDAVYYSCDNFDFKDYIRTTIGYKEAYGSFSDISNLSPYCDKASVNLSCGYYNAHTLEEYVIYEEMYATFKQVKKLLANAKECDTYDYQEETWWSDRWAINDSWYGYGYSGTKGKYSIGNTTKTYEIVFNDEDGTENSDFLEANTIEEALGKFFFEHVNTCYNDIIDYFVITDYEEVI